MEIDHIIKGFKTEYNELEELSVDRKYTMSKNDKVDTTYVMELKFSPDIEAEEQNKLKQMIGRRFLFELKEKAHVRQDSVPILLR